MRNKCLFCIFRKNKKSLKCQYCDHFVLSSKKMREGISYLQQGFSKINKELDDLEQKVCLVTGVIFRRHKYSAEDLQDSAQMDRIKSFAAKIRSDVENWERAGKLSLRLRNEYNENAEAVQERIHEITRLIQDRRPTLWEHVGNFFRRLFRAIVNLLPKAFQRMIIGARYKAFPKKEAA